MEGHFPLKHHQHAVLGDVGNYQITKHRSNINVYNNTWKHLSALPAIGDLTQKMHLADKVILHGLWDSRLIKLLWAMPWLLKKCYWVIWGGDLYCYSLGKRDKHWQRMEFYRRPVIKNLGNIINYTTGDYLLAKEWYGTTARHHRCFVYPNNLYHPASPPSQPHSGVNILVGNSADPSNCHSEIFQRLECVKTQNVKIFTPLTYGSNDYTQKVLREGASRFGNKFKAITKHKPFDKYLDFLSSMDIAIFNHPRQQAMGTIRTLLGMGKKVYMRKELTSTQALIADGIKVFCMDNFSLHETFPEKQDNITIVKELYSKKSLLDSLNKIWIS